MSKAMRYISKTISFKRLLNEETSPLLIKLLSKMKAPATTEESVVTEATVSSKIDAILAGEKDVPESRRAIIADIVNEFDHTKDEISALEAKIAEKIQESDPVVLAILKQVNELDAEVLEDLNKNKEKFIGIIRDGASEEGHLKDFVTELLADLSKFTDEQLKSAMTLEHKLANALLS